MGEGGGDVEDLGVDFKLWAQIFTQISTYWIVNSVAIYNRCVHEKKSTFLGRETDFSLVGMSFVEREREKEKKQPSFSFDDQLHLRISLSYI